MQARNSAKRAFFAVWSWMNKERDTYQTEKFDYKTEPDKPIEYWEQQFDSYIQRLRVFPTDSELHTQAALKLAATAVAYSEHCVNRTAIPKPGVPSGTVEQYRDIRQ